MGTNNESLRKWIRENCTVLPVDQAAIEAYEREMVEVTIPKIEADLREQRRLAHYLRLGIPAPSRATPNTGQRAGEDEE